MSSALDIQIVNTPNLEKIENFLKNSLYRESIEFTTNFNTRLCIERRLRLPKNHSNLFMDKRQRMPGFRQGQIYTYPAARWRKSRRQYLSKMYRFPDRPFQSVRKDSEAVIGAAAGTATIGAYGNNTNSATIITASTVNVPLAADNDFNGTILQEESSSLGAAGGDTSDSKDSQQHLKEDLPKEWFYDDMDINEMDSLEEPKSPADDEYDYDPRYGNKKRRKRRPGKKALGASGEGGGGGRKRQGGGGRGGGSSAGADGNTGESGSTTTGRSGPGRGGGRGRRKPKSDSGVSRAAANPPSPSIEPPSFEMAAAAVSNIAGGDMGTDEHGELRNYRKYL